MNLIIKNEFIDIWRNCWTVYRAPWKDEKIRNKVTELPVFLLYSGNIALLYFR